MSSILLQQDDDEPIDTDIKQETNIKIESEMFGDNDEEEENEDVDMPSSDGILASGSTQHEVDIAPPPSDTKYTLPPVPSPFMHHNTGPSSDRLRNAMHRISSNPEGDAEAWAVLMNEVGSCWRSLGPLLDNVTALGSSSLGGVNGETWRKIDWIEACYMALLHHFPYASVYIVGLGEIYMRLVARTADEIGQCVDFNTHPVLTAQALMMGSFSGGDRWRYYDDRLNGLFESYLGVNADGSQAMHGFSLGDALDAMSATTVEGAQCLIPQSIHSVPLWNLYIRKRSWNAAHSAAGENAILPPPIGYQPNITQVSVLLQRYEESLRAAFKARKERIWNETEKAYECALAGGAGYIDQNQMMWRNYTNFVKSWTDPVDCSAFVTTALPAPPSDPGYQVTVQQKQLTVLRSVYQRGITHPMLGLDQYWQEYEAFERQHSEALASVLIAEWLPKYQHARGVFLERGRVWNASELRGGRLAVPPVGFGDGKPKGGAVAGTGIAEDLGDAAIGGANKPTNEAEYVSQMEEERSMLSKWRRRAAYERTNPERLTSSDLIGRVRTGYTEAACAFGRHPEVWYEWSQWELLHGSSIAASVSVTPGQQNAPINGGSSVSSTMLIAPAKAGDLKSGGNAIRALAVLTLGMKCLPDCALLAQAQADILEKHLGVTSGESKNEKHGCIQVMERFVNRSPTTLGFVLLQRLARRYQGISAARAVFSRARRTLKIRDEDEMEGEEEAAAEGTADAAKGASRKMVTSRLNGENDSKQSSDGTNAGYITWHLYAAHATIEHRLGKNPQVAARIYELGLRKHRSFISTPPYVLHYASLLLELNDEENLRSLLMRAVAACEEEDANTKDGESDAAAATRRQEVQRPLWDMMLKFESILSSRTNNGNVATDVAAIEVRRRKALYGAGNEDVVMGREGPPDEEDLSIGIQKSSLNEQLIRLEGYDVASRISNGMARVVDVLTVTGAIGSGEFDTSSLDFASGASASLAAGGASSNVWGDICAGGASDVSYVQRLRFQRESRSRAAAAALGGVTGAQGIAAGTKLLSAKERAAGAALGIGMNAMAIQIAPEWLRPLLMLLPPIPKFGRGLQKPPPHLVEMTLLTLKGNNMPATRPVVAAATTNGGANLAIKRERDADDSDDDEDGGAGGAYSNQFRARQRARLAAGGSAAP
ncbi:hypothetical protein ACHAXN_011306 [Cyclotella atomus]